MPKRDIIILSIFVILIGWQTAIESANFLKKISLEKVAGISVKEKPDPFIAVDILAKGAVVWDAKDNKILYGKKEDVQLPLASLSKIMTTLIVLKEGSGTTTISREDIEEEGDSGLLVKENWQTEDLVKLTLVASANDGAKSLARNWEKKFGLNEDSFVSAMNEEAKSLGLKQTYFLNATGLDVSSGTAGGYGSAYDIARLFYHAVLSYPDVFESTSKENLAVISLDNRKHLVKNTNSSVGQIPGIIASKTGFTDLSGGNLVVFMDMGLNHPVIIAVLGSTEEGRFTDVNNLAKRVIFPLE